ncbi:MAG: hypothetical protein JNL33_04050 [Betaproteobacteria bacterium]|nr:hypothetical protein [Betaproteobacteria bacterium]
MRRRWLLTTAGALLAPLCASPARAFRVLPQNAAFGMLEDLAPPFIKISGKTYRLAPGSRFRDRDNRILVPVSAPRSGKIAFTLDQLGQVLGIWLLTPSEIAVFEARDTAR